MRSERRSPPVGAGEISPVAAKRCNQRTALAILTPKRFAAALRDMPPSVTASTTRLRRSSDSAISRGRGIGTRLIEDLRERGVRLGKPVTLEVIHGNPAKSLYLRLGFRPTGEDLDKTHMILRLPLKSKPKTLRTHSAPHDEG